MFKEAALKLLLNENTINWNSQLDCFDPGINITSLTNLSARKQFAKEYYDVYLFDIHDDLREDLEFITKLKSVNPNIKTIAFTGKKNRKYRCQILLKAVDLFLFRETDIDLLITILKRIHLRLTKAH